MDEGVHRAERLATLLTSRNGLIRREASEALGRFPLTNPSIPSLIRQYLQNSSWETRVDAAKTLRLILTSVSTASKEVVPSTKLLKSLDLTLVVRDYYPLLSCENEVVFRMGSCSCDERRKFMDKQRKFVDEQLRLQTKAGVSCAPFVTQDDFINYTDSEKNAEVKVILNEQEICDDFDLKLHQLCVQLLTDLADSKWEIRHGAALAFSAILSSVPSRLSSDLIDLISTRFFQTLALDNFIDFASGRSAVGPVRECIADCIAKLFIAYPNEEFIETVANHIFALYNIKETNSVATTSSTTNTDDLLKHLWFQRQAALLVLKYHFAGHLYHLKFEQFYGLIKRSFEDTHDEVSSAALSAITALFCKENLKDDITEFLSHIELIIYRFIDAACSATKQQQLQNQDATFEECCMQVVSSLFRLVLFTAPYETEKLIEACISCAYCISAQITLLNQLPFALVETFGRWSACLMLDAKCAQIDDNSPLTDVTKHNVGEFVENERLELMCGDEIRALPDMERIDALITRKVHIARFLAPLLSAIHSFPSMIGNQSLSDATELLITPMLSSPAIMHRLGGSLLTHSWFSYNWSISKNESNPPIFLVALLQKMVLQSQTFAYDDEKFFFHYMESAYKEFVSYCRRKGIRTNEIEHIENSAGSVDVYARKVFDMCLLRIKKDDDRSALNSHYENFNNIVATAKAVMTLNVLRVNALLVSALITVYPQIVCESNSLNPFVKPFMELLRSEENSIVARHALNSLPILFRITSVKKPSPHAKMIKQIVTNLTSCENHFPQDFELCEATVLSQKINGTASVRSQNAEFAIRALGIPFACVELSDLLDFRKFDSPKVKGMYMDAFRVYVDELHATSGTAPVIVRDVLPELKIHLCAECAALRFCAARCVNAIVRLDGVLIDVLNSVVIPLQKELRSGVASISARCGLVELLFFMSQLSVEVIGALRLIAPLSLRLMTDSCEEVRQTAAIAFRNFVPLMAIKADRAKNGKILSKNDGADSEITDCSIDLLLGDPSRLSPLKVDQIKGLCSSVILRPYQQEGIRWMSFLEEYGLNGILADDMGLGKTLQTLCLVALKIHDKPTAKILVVCPPTLVGHWCVEWSKYFPNLAPFHKVNEGVKDQNSLAMSGSQFATVASYNTIRACSYFQDIDWYYVILDEGHAIRNPTTQTFKSVTSLRAQNRLILSGTPVQNTPADLWALFQFLMPGYLGSMKQFKTTFLKAINACRNVNASPKEIQDGENALERLHKAVLPFVMRRLKTDVLNDLPDKIVQDYLCVMTDVQRALYEHIIDLCKTGLNSTEQQSEQRLSALETITELRKCVVHPVLVGAKAKTCFNSVIFGVAVESGKMKALGQLLCECGIGSMEEYTTSEYSVQDSGVSTLDSHRALIFCQRLSTLQIIADFFNSGQLGINIRYSILDGTVPVNERYAIAENFNNDPGIDVLLLTTSVGGEGLNLIGADVVIFVEHDWNPVKDLQAMDRAHRIGQKRTVNVYRLITESSIEQKIMRYQKFKTDTANALVGADNRSLQTMATEQLVELFTLEGSGNGKSTPSSVGQSVTSSQKISKRSESQQALSNAFDPVEKWDLQELWDQSQYDCYNAVNIAMEANDNASLKKLKRHSSDVPSSSNLFPTKQSRRHC
ncbi:unnamed protein product [Anisakis simplex]|uniref:HEAT repeat-containing protein n=1 Tax=Anisakis simplex TaxID=6269 RepID=A0A0M3IY74_ANISI|nr:unnamed protein product [Anisakis simplex]